MPSSSRRSSFVSTSTSRPQIRLERKASFVFATTSSSIEGLHCFSCSKSEPTHSATSCMSISASGFKVSARSDAGMTALGRTLEVIVTGGGTVCAAVLAAARATV